MEMITTESLFIGILGNCSRHRITWLTSQTWSSARNTKMSFLRNTKQLLSHRREASFLSLLVRVIIVVYQGSCETVILDHHSRYDQSWDWLTTYELASGSGWSRSSQTGEYLVCDLAETTTKSTNSWLISNFIDLQGAASVSVKVEFTARQCDLPSLPFCKWCRWMISFFRKQRNRRRARD